MRESQSHSSSRSLTEMMGRLTSGSFPLTRQQRRNLPAVLIVAAFLFTMISVVTVTLFWDDLFGVSSGPNWRSFVAINRAKHASVASETTGDLYSSSSSSQTSGSIKGGFRQHNSDYRRSSAETSNEGPIIEYVDYSDDDDEDPTRKDYQGKPKVVIGYCCDEASYAAKCNPQPFVTALAQGTFPKHRIIYSQCDRTGLAPFHTANFSSDNITLQRAHSDWLTHTTDPIVNWIRPDIHLCQGFFYHPSLVDTRRKTPKEDHIEYTPLMRERMTQSEFRFLKTPYLVRHTRGRSFLTTHNTEPWGGGSCNNRYDVIMESNWDRNWHGCVSYHIPPSFFFEYQRMLNNTNELIRIPDSIREKHRIAQTLEEKTDFALFLVRDCFIRYYRQDTLVRVVFYELLSKHYKQVTAGGGCKRNMEKHLSLGLDYCPKNARNGWFLGKKYQCKGFGYTDGVVQMIRHYKFYLSMENSMRLGYSTEKILNSYYGNSIPIYFGDERVNEYINPRSFIHCHITQNELDRLLKLNRSLQYDDLEHEAQLIVEQSLMDCVNQVKQVDSNHTLYLDMLSQPVFKNNHWKDTVLDPNYLGMRLRNVLRLHESYLIDDDLYSEDSWDV